MPYLLQDLVIDRVDVVEEGACSAAFIEICKRKEKANTMSFEEIIAKMKPEHADVIKAELKKSTDKVAELTGQVETLNADVQKANRALTDAQGALSQTQEELRVEKAKNEELSKAGCGGKKKTSKAGCGSCDEEDEEEVIKSMPEAAQALFKTMKAQKEAAEEEIRKAKDAELTAQAVAKAKNMKSLPIEENALVDILKSADEAVVNLLSATAAAIDGTVLTEVGKSAPKGPNDAWATIEAEASKIAKERNITEQKAVSVVIKEKPELYKQYLEGGAN